jgi:hypothetical protein
MASFLLAFLPKSYMHYPCPMRAKFPVHLFLFVLIIISTFCEKYKLWSFPLRHSDHPPTISSIFGTNILITLFSDTFSLCYSINVRDQVSHTYKTTDKIINIIIIINYISCSSRAQSYLSILYPDGSETIRFLNVMGDLLNSPKSLLLPLFCSEDLTILYCRNILRHYQLAVQPSYFIILLKYISKYVKLTNQDLTGSTL